MNAFACFSQRSYRLVFKHLVQPWHPQSAIMAEAGLAVKQLCGVQKFFEFSAALFKEQKRYASCLLPMGFPESALPPFE